MNFFTKDITVSTLYLYIFFKFAALETEFLEIKVILTQGTQLDTPLARIISTEIRHSCTVAEYGLGFLVRDIIIMQVVL